MNQFVIWAIISVGLVILAISFFCPLDDVPDDREP